MSSKNERCEIANRVLKTFVPDTEIRLCPTGYVLVRWKDFNRAEWNEKRWMTRGQDFYPVWHRRWGHGGTATTALAQLVRWIQGKPVLPLSSWRYWAGDKCRLLRQADATQPLAEMEAAGYPRVGICVLCDRELHGTFDWWSLNGVTGTCCSMREGCLQKGPKRK